MISSLNKTFIALILSFTFCGISSNICAQDHDITYVKKGLGYKFERNGYNITPEKLKEILNSNAKSARAYKKGNFNKVMVSFLSFAGGLVMGYPIGMAIGGDSDYLAFSAVGVGMVALAVPFGIKYNKQIIEAVDIYNILDD